MNISDPAALRVLARCIPADAAIGQRQIAEIEYSSAAVGIARPARSVVRDGGVGDTHHAAVNPNTAAAAARRTARHDRIGNRYISASDRHRAAAIAVDIRAGRGVVLEYAADDVQPPRWFSSHYAR